MIRAHPGWIFRPRRVNPSPLIIVADDVLLADVTLKGLGDSLLASRQIPVHYDVADLEADLETLRSLGRA